MQGFVKPCKDFDFRASIRYRCECIKRNGLQDRCLVWDCMGKPECMTKLYPVCEPGRAALLRLTDLGDVEVALKKFYCADQVREAALAAYCRLACDKARQKQVLSCCKSPNVSFCAPLMCTPRIPKRGDCNVDDDNLCKPVPCAPTRVSPNCTLQSSGTCPFVKLEEPSSCNLPPVICLPSYPPICPTRISCSAF